MKNKFTLLVLLAALLVPMTLNAKTKISKNVQAFSNKTEKVAMAKRGDATMPMAVKPSGNIHMLAMPKAEGETLVWDFEDADAGLSTFTLLDKDGDGFNWTYYNNDVADQSGDKHMTTHEGVGVIASASYDNDTNTPLTPDNWLISPEVTLGGALSFWAMGQDASYAAEVFGVYVSTDGENWTQVGTDKTATDVFELYEFDLSAYDGQTGKFAIVHHNVTDMFMLNVDDITFNPAAQVTPDPTMPTDLTAEPTTTTAQIAWVPGDNNSSWDLRWRPWTNPALINNLWDLPVPGYESQVNGWRLYDADGDGNNWGLAYSGTTQDDACFSSASYSGGALTPDNWLITPEVGMGGTLKFKTWNRSASYLDKIMVYYAPADWTALSDFVAISEFIEPAVTTKASAQEIEIDLSAYEGLGVIAFRHYDCEDMWAIYIDDIQITVPNGIDPSQIPNWNVVQDVTNPYTIEGLTPETNYEVQVMAYNQEGDKSTDWTESTIFTTLAEEPQPTHTYTVAGSPAGFFGTEWDTTNEANDMTLNAETGKYEWTSTEATLDAGANVEFKVTEDHSWDVSYGLNGGADNVVLTAEKAGKYTLTVYFDPQNNNNVTGELTLIEEIVPEYSEFYVVGEFNDWNQTADGGRVALEEKEAGVYEAALTLEAGQDGEFKVITFNEDGTTKWFGGADENNVGFFLINSDMLGIDITLTNGSNFRPEVAGNYTIQIYEKPATTGLQAISEPLVMKIVKNADTAIETISTSAVDNTWYNLQGVKFNGKPSVPGIYINGGKKVIVK